MKQNTKFLWMYICILFSFAIILIIFAGLSTNEEKGLENKVEKVSSENNALKKENTTLKNSIKSKDEAIATANQNYTQLKSEKEVVDAQNSNYKVYESNEIIISQALTEYENGNKDKSMEFLNQIDVNTLNVSQKYIYNMIKTENKQNDNEGKDA